MVKIKLVDYGACIGCETCENVCGFLHEKSYSKIYATPDGILLPVTCAHCSRPACVEVCPTGALFKDPETGAVRIRQFRCIGCSMCAVACPFGVPELNPKTGVIDKCQLCYERLEEGLLPACSEMCPAGIIYYGDVEEVFGKVKTRAMEFLRKLKVLAEERAKVLSR